MRGDKRCLDNAKRGLRALYPILSETLLPCSQCPFPPFVLVCCAKGCERIKRDTRFCNPLEIGQTSLIRAALLTVLSATLIENLLYSTRLFVGLNFVALRTLTKWFINWEDSNTTIYYTTFRFCIFRAIYTTYF